MKQIMKKRAAAALAAALAVSMCTAFAGCGKGGDSTTTSGTVGTFPTDSSTTETTTETTSGSDGTTESTSATTETTTGGTVTPPSVGKYTNPLTGEPMVSDVSNQRPLAIVVDNNNLALPNQTGLDQADVLYEALVAPGITRFLAVYADYNLVDEVCNIRSGRDYHLNWAAHHNAVLMCHGASNTPNYDFYQLAVDRLGSRWGFIDTQFEYYFSSMEAGVKYGTIDNWGSRNDLKYDTVFKPSALNALLHGKTAGDSKYAVLANGSMNGYAKETFKFVPYGTKKDMTGASDATTVQLKFGATGTPAIENVSFHYDSASGKYLRSQDGVVHVDSQTGKRLAFTNVLTLFADTTCVQTGIANDPYMTLMDTRSLNGLGYYFYDGKVIQIKCFSDGTNLSLYDPNGNDLLLATGNTYVGYLDPSALSAGEFWD